MGRVFNYLKIIIIISIIIIIMIIIIVIIIIIHIPFIMDVQAEELLWINNDEGRHHVF